PLVIGVAAGMCRTRGMTHEEDAAGVYSDLPGVLVRPGHDRGDILGRAGIAGVVGEAIPDIDSDNAVARKVSQHVGIDLVGPVAVTVEKSAAMHEQNRRAAAVRPSGQVDIESLTGVRAVGNVGPDLDAFRWRSPMYLAEFFQHQLDVLRRRPLAAHLRPHFSP